MTCRRFNLRPRPSCTLVSCSRNVSHRFGAGDSSHWSVLREDSTSVGSIASTEPRTKLYLYGKKYQSYGLSQVAFGPSEDWQTNLTSISRVASSGVCRTQSLIPVGVLQGFNRPITTILIFFFFFGCLSRYCKPIRVRYICIEMILFGISTI